jgi:hypothetical protein
MNSFTTKDTKRTKFGGISIRDLRVLRVFVVKSFSALQKNNQFVLTKKPIATGTSEVPGTDSSNLPNLK